MCPIVIIIIIFMYLELLIIDNPSTDHEERTRKNGKTYTNLLILRYVAVLFERKQKIFKSTLTNNKKNKKRQSQKKNRTRTGLPLPSGFDHSLFYLSIVNLNSFVNPSINHLIYSATGCKQIQTKISKIVFRQSVDMKISPLIPEKQ